MPAGTNQEGEKTKDSLPINIYPVEAPFPHKAGQVLDKLLPFCGRAEEIAENGLSVRSVVTKSPSSQRQPYLHPRSLVLQVRHLLDYREWDPIHWVNLVASWLDEPECHVEVG